MGLSLDANCDLHPYIWQNGAMTSLNRLIPANSPLSFAAGELHGYLAKPSTGAQAARGQADPSARGPAAFHAGPSAQTVQR